MGKKYMLNRSARYLTCKIYNDTWGIRSLNAFYRYHEIAILFLLFFRNLFVLEFGFLVNVPKTWSSLLRNSVIVPKTWSTLQELTRPFANELQSSDSLTKFNNYHFVPIVRNSVRFGTCASATSTVRQCKI